MKRVIIPAVAFIAGMAIVPSVFATAKPIPVGTVALTGASGACDGFTNTPVLTQDGDNYTIQFNYTGDGLCFVQTKDAGTENQVAHNRKANVAYIGYNMTAPTEIDTVAEAQAVKHVWNSNTDNPGSLWSEMMQADDNAKLESLKNGGLAQMYFGVSAEKLDEATKAGQTELIMTSTWYWPGEDGATAEQVVTLKIDTRKITLQGYDEDGDLVEVFTPEMAAENIKAAAETGTDDNTDDGTENPDTADTIATYLTIAAVALLGLGATAFVAKKSNR